MYAVNTPVSSYFAETVLRATQAPKQQCFRVATAVRVLLGRVCDSLLA